MGYVRTEISMDSTQFLKFFQYSVELSALWYSHCRKTPQTWTFTASGDTNWGTCGWSGNMPNPRTVKLPKTNSRPPYTTKGSFYNGSSPEIGNWLFYRGISKFSSIWAVLEIMSSALSMRANAWLLSHISNVMVSNSILTQLLNHHAWTLRIFHLKHFRWLKHPINDLTSNVQILLKKKKTQKIWKNKAICLLQKSTVLNNKH
jgi:hypothetical protein